MLPLFFFITLQPVYNFQRAATNFIESGVFIYASMNLHYDNNLSNSHISLFGSDKNVLFIKFPGCSKLYLTNHEPTRNILL